MRSSNKNVVDMIAAFVFLVAVSVLIGWYYNLTFLVSIAPNMIAMNPVTAIAFLLLSVWLIKWKRGNISGASKVIDSSIGITVFSVGTLKILEYTKLSQLHIDRLLFTTKLDSLVIPNVMALSTAVLFTLAGVLILNSTSLKKVNLIVNDIVLITSFLISYLGIIGYIYSLEPFYRIGPLVPMALNTSISFNLLLVALFLTLPEGNLKKIFFSKYIGGRLIRRAIPLVLFIPAGFGYFRLFVHRAGVYDMEYSMILDTGFLVLVVLILMFYYARILNKNEDQREKAEKIIVQNEAKFRLLVYALKEGVIYYDKYGKILFYNPSMAKMTGYGPDELIGANVLDTFPPEENKASAHQRMSDRVRGIAEDYESVIMHKNGTRINVFITARPISGAGNSEAATFLSTVIDITERKKREEDVEAFSASAAHDLSAPLARIESICGFILQSVKGQVSKDDIEYLEMVLKISVDMRQLLKDLLSFYRIGIDNINKVPVDMYKIVNEVISGAARTHTKFHVDHLPHCYGDPIALKQVWANLILNAIKYSSKNENPEVTIGFIEQDEKATYFVKDNGVGFDMREFPKLFTPFKRLHTDFEGNGLGLPIVKRIIEKHGGRIWAESDIHKGATFYFTV